MDSVMSTLFATIAAIMFGTYSIMIADIIKNILKLQESDGRISQEITAGFFQFMVFVGAVSTTLIVFASSIIMCSLHQVGSIISLLEIDWVSMGFLILVHFVVNYIVILAIFREAVSRIFALVAYSPIFAAIMAYIILGETITVFQAAIIVFCLVGLTLVMDPQHYIKESSIKNLFMMLLIPIIFGLQNTLFKIVLIKAMNSIASLSTETGHLLFVISVINVIIFASTALLALLLFIFLRLKQQQKHMYSTSTRSNLIVLMGGLLFAVGSIASFLALNVQKVALVVTIITMQSIIPILYGKIRLRETLSKKMMLGFIIAIAGVLILTYSA